MKKILTVILLLCLILNLQAQRRNGLIGYRTAIGDGILVLNIGPDYCFADPYSSKGFFGPIANQSVLNNRDISIGFRQIFSTNLSFTFLGLSFTSGLGYKAAFSYDNFTGDDKTYPLRNFSFNSLGLQLTGQGEYSLHFSTKRYDRYQPHTLYAFLGIGGLYSNADLIKGTDGHSGYTYKNNYIAPVIPYGIGYHYNFNSDYYIGAEIKWEYTFSDFIDGFKPPVDVSKNNDLLLGFAITFGYKVF